MYTITFDVHIVKQQEIESPVEVIAIRITIVNQQILFWIALLFPSGSLDLKGFKGQRYRIPK